jgi:deoxyribodipyrimidine photo-lyase
VPELAALPDAFLQEPWKWPGAKAVLGRLYPEPIVDVTAAARAARDACWGLRKDRNFRTEIVEVIERHASRADARFVNDRSPKAAPRRRATDAAQMSLDL